MIVQIFEHYYSQIYKKNYSLNLKDSQKHIDSFYKIFDKKGFGREVIGINFLERFLLFQFEYWGNKETARKPQLHWFVGKKAIDRFLEVDDWKLANYWANLNVNVKPFRPPKEDSDYSIEQRKKYHNTKRGLQYCLEHTDLYKKCVPCLTCNYKNSCKTILKENYPLLYRRRK